MKFQDLTGQKFGRLTVIERAENRGKMTMWNCRCVCGNRSRVNASHLKSRHTTSCGCFMVEATSARATTHGGYKTAEHKVWAGMLSRIRNPNNRRYADYGGRGITVCDRWLAFENFLLDMGPRPTPKHSIERKVNDLGYFPENCYWATSTEQGRNKRNNLFVEYGEQTKTLKEWSEILGIKYITLYMRVTQLGMSIEEAFNKPVGRWAK